MRLVAGLGLCAAMAASGCATGGTRLESEPPRLVGTVAPAAAGEPTVRAIDEAVDGNRRSLLRCFDRLGERLASDRPIAVELLLSVGDAGVMLAGVRPRDPATVVDGELRDCVDEVVSGWRLDGARFGEVSLALRVTPRRTRPSLRAQAGPAPLFVPEE